MTKAQQQERAEAIVELKALLPEGATVYSIVRSVARSGMSREISFLIFANSPYAQRVPAEPAISPMYLSPLFSMVLGWGMSKSDRAAIKVQGCGMDMCFHTLDRVRSALGYKAQFRSELL